MLKKTLPILALCSTALFAYAHKGLYFGVMGTQNSFTLQSQQQNQYIAQNLTGPSFGGYLGYNLPLTQHLSMAVEGFGDYSTASTTRDLMSPKNTVTGASTQENYTQSNPLNYGLSLLPNYTINSHTTYFARLGITQSQIKKTGYSAGDTRPNFNKTILGYEMGFGVQTKLGSHFTLRGEFDYLYYPKFSLTSPPQTTSSDGETSTRTTIKPSSARFTVGLSYYFDRDTSNEQPYQVLPSTLNKALYYTYTTTAAPRVLHVNGLYLGMGAGFSSLTIVQNQESILPHTIAPTPSHQFNNLDLAAFSPAAHLFLGYSSALSRHIYLGLEGEFTYATLKDTFSPTTTTSTQTRYQFNESANYSLTLNPGLLIDPSNLLYLKLGVIQGQFELSNTATQATALKDKADFGFVLGGGYEFAISQHVSLRAEYDYKQFTPIKTHQIEPDDTVVSSKYAPFTNSFSMGLNYRF